MSFRKVHLRKLLLDAEQQHAIGVLYMESKNTESLYNQNLSEEQQNAKAKLLMLGLDPDSRNALENRWTAQYSEREVEKGANRKPENWQRRVPYPFTGCLAHIEVTERVGDGAISRIAGFPEHNGPCQMAVLERVPRIPLHEHVYEVALEQLQCGASLTAIQETNSKMVDNQAYRGMSTYDPKTANVRYLFLPTDHTSLYRKASQNLGVDVRLQPQYNVDDWLNPESTNFKPEVTEAVFHYSARAEAGDRFEICLSTPEMDTCAHKYAHHSQLILDGTFGVCSARLLLFIALAVDESNKGVPIALFLFSAETGAKATHASYNTAILEKLIQTWKLRLETKFGSFEPYSC
ncbi:hypothetical protein GG344DRAFT_52937 [Lentinula edodes]|nr:hypothetical protein GG344DRAFT_52937 [Lentinula edodes]